MDHDGKKYTIPEEFLGMLMLEEAEKLMKRSVSGVLEFIGNHRNSEDDKKRVMDAYKIFMCLTTCAYLKIEMGINLNEELNILDERLKGLYLSDEALKDFIRISRSIYRIVNNERLDLFKEFHGENALCLEIVSFFENTLTLMSQQENNKTKAH